MQVITSGRAQTECRLRQGPRLQVITSLSWALVGLCCVCIQTGLTLWSRDNLTFCIYSFGRAGCRQLKQKGGTVESLFAAPKEGAGRWLILVLWRGAVPAVV